MRVAPAKPNSLYLKRLKHLSNPSLNRFVALFGFWKLGRSQHATWPSLKVKAGCYLIVEKKQITTSMLRATDPAMLHRATYSPVPHLFPWLFGYFGRGKGFCFRNHPIHAFFNFVSYSTPKSLGKLLYQEWFLFGDCWLVPESMKHNVRAKLKKTTCICV